MDGDSAAGAAHGGAPDGDVASGTVQGPTAGIAPPAPAAWAPPSTPAPPRPLSWTTPVDPAWAPPGGPAPWAAPDPRTALVPAAGWYEWQPPAGLPTRSRAARSVAALVVGVLVLAGAGAGATALYDRVAGGPDDASLAAARQELDVALPGLKAFVESSTGRRWTSDVQVELLSEKDFLAALDEDGGRAKPPPSDDEDDIGSTFEAMRLVPDADTFYDGWDERRPQYRWDADDETDIVGFYDDTTGRLAVRGPVWDAATEYTVVHELAHALQDQTFDLSRVTTSDRSDDETSTVTRAVIEGDAELTAMDYYDAQPSSWQEEFDDEGGGGGTSSDPDEIVASTLGYFPYEAGPVFVRAVRDAGGAAAVDRLFTTRPTTTRDIFAPGPWIAGRAPDVEQPPFPSPAPGTAGDVVDYGALGVLGLWVTAKDPSPDLSTTKALAGWRGDAYVTTEIDGRVCMTDDAVFADARSRATARAYLAPWATSVRATIADRGATGLRLRSCHR